MKAKQKLVFSLLVGCTLLGLHGAYAESLWNKATTNSRGMFAERKAAGVGDILTVSVSETNSYKMDLKDESAKTASTFDNPLHRYLLREAAGFVGFDKSRITQDKFTSTSNHAGTGEISLENYSLATNFTVTVVDVLPNDNLVIEGVRRVTFGEQTLYSILRGIVRSDDVSSRNIVESSKIGDMHVEVIEEGSLSAAQRKGILSRMNDSINLF